MHRFIDDLTPEKMVAWFHQYGGTDNGYLHDSFPRFAATYNFILPALSGGRLIIADIGAHWLHHAFFYANDGHKLLCADVPNTMGLPNVRRAAEALGAELIAYRRLDLAESIKDIPESSVDIVIFSEIIEHIAFNPIPMWDAIYKMMKPGGKLFVTTPNAMYFPSIVLHIKKLLTHSCYGITVEDIIGGGTYSHHWKEYSIPELEKYFSTLSRDFSVTRTNTWSEGSQDSEELRALISFTAEDFAVSSDQAYWSNEYILKRILINMEAAGITLIGRVIFMEITLLRKQFGIEIRPPWLPA